MLGHHVNLVGKCHNYVLGHACMVHGGAGGIGVTMHDMWPDPLRCVSGDWLVVMIACD